MSPAKHAFPQVNPHNRAPKQSLSCGTQVRVKPGLTGLWQVSGRADLSWDQSVNLDLRYVDNWSLAMDLMILCKTLRVVLFGSGAY